MELNPLAAMLSILGVTMALSRFSRERKEVLLFSATYMIFCLMFLAAVANVATFVAPILRWGGLVGFIVAVTVRKDSVARDIIDFFTPGVVFYILAAMLSVSLFQSSHLQYWDEFSHWGLRAKEFASHGSLYGYTPLSASAYYPPGTAVWSYIVTGSQYSEFGAYFAQFLLLLAPATVLFSGITWRECYWSVPALVLLVYLVTAFGHGIQSLYVDHLLGMVLGGVLLAALKSRDKASDLWPFIAPLAALPLIKEAGTFCAVAGVVFLAAMILAGKQWKSGGWKQWGLACAVLLAAPFIASASWKAASGWAGIERTGFNQSPSVAVMVEEASSGYQGYRKEVWNRLSQVVQSQQVAKNEVSGSLNEFSWDIRDLFTDPYRLSTIGFFGLFLAFMFLRALTVTGPDRRKVLVAAGVLSVLFWLYMAGLFWLYLYGFLENNALRIPSYLRYLHVFLLPLFLGAAGLCMPVFSNDSPRKLSGAVLLTILLVFLYGFERPNLGILHTPNPGYPNLEPFVPFVNAAGDVAGPDGAVLIIMDDKEAVEHIFQYIVAPVPVRFVPAAAAVSDPGRFGKALKETDAVFVLQPNEQFARAFPTLMSAVKLSPVIGLEHSEKGMGLKPIPLAPPSQ